MTPEDIGKDDRMDQYHADLTGTQFFNRYDGSSPNVPSTTGFISQVARSMGTLGPHAPMAHHRQQGKIPPRLKGILSFRPRVRTGSPSHREKSQRQKPYEESWYTKVHGRWYGKGVAEKVMNLQLYLNTILNTRVSRAIVQQLGLFKIKRGSNITPQIFHAFQQMAGSPSTIWTTSSLWNRPIRYWRFIQR